jgi:hypothetical protein
MEVLSKQNNDGTLTKSGPKQLLVTEESATRTGLPDMFHQHIPIDADHSGLVKFESRSHGSYEIVMQKIKKYVAEAPEAVSKRLLNSSIRTFACTRTMLKAFGHISRIRGQG